MATSAEVAQLFAQQNQMFQQQAAYAQRIGMAVPGSVGSFTPMNMSGMTPGSTFNYGAAGSGHGAGDRAGAAAMGTLSGVGTAASIGIGAAGLFGKIPAGIAPFVDPFAAFGAARGLGAGIMGGLGAAMIPMGIAAGAGMMMSGVVSGGHQQGAVNSALGNNYNFVNPSNQMGGMGFNRQDAQGIGAMVRQMGTLPEMMSSMQELTGIMARLPKMGVMQGLTSVSDFAGRFKEAIKTISDTSRILGTTMDEAANFFQHSRGVGFLGRTEQLRNALNVQVTSGVTGLSNGQVMGLQTAGANMATAGGATRGLGAAAVTAVAQSIGLAQRAGIIPEGLLESITGQEGPEAVAAGAQRYAGMVSGMATGTSVGRMLLLGMTKLDGNGRAVLDKDVAAQFRNHALSAKDLQRMGERKTRNLRLAKEFMARQADLGQEFAAAVGPGGVGQAVGEIMRGDATDANLVIQRMGGTAGDADIMKAMGNADPSELEHISKTMAVQSLRKQASDPKALIRRALQKVHNQLVDPFNKVGAAIHNWAGNAVDEMWVDFIGDQIVTVSKEASKSFAGAVAGGAEGKEDLKRIFGSMTKVSQSEGSLSLSARAGSALRGMMGEMNDSERVAWFQKISGGQDLKERAGVLQGGGGLDAGVQGGLNPMVRSLIDERGSAFYKMSDAEKITTAVGDMNSSILDFARGAGEGSLKMNLVGGNFAALTDAQIDAATQQNPSGVWATPKSTAAAARSQNTARLIKSMRNAGISGGDQASGYLTQVYAGYSKDAAVGGLTNFFAAMQGVKGLGNMRGKADEHDRVANKDLMDAFGDAHGALLKDNQQLREMVGRALADPKKLTEYLSHVNGDETDLVIAQALGISPGDVGSAREILQDLGKGDKTKMTKALGSKQVATDAKAGVSLMGAITASSDAALMASQALSKDGKASLAELVGGVAKSMATLGGGKNGMDTADLRSKLDGLFAVTAGMSNGDRNAMATLLQGAGLDSAIRKSGTFKAGAKTSMSNFMSKMGLDPTDQKTKNVLAKYFPGGVTDNLSQEAINTGLAALTHYTAGVGKSSGGASVESILQKIDGNQDRMVTALQAIIGVQGIDKAVKVQVKKWQDAANEDAKVKGEDLQSHDPGHK